jgi:hypothetical protein
MLARVAMLVTADRTGHFFLKTHKNTRDEIPSDRGDDEGGGNAYIYFFLSFWQ